MSKEEPEVMNLKQLKQALLIQSDAKGRNCYHYTNMKSLLAMLGNGRMFLTRADKLNDADEDFPCSRRFYVSCFSAHNGENVAMWAIYGRGQADALRLRFSERTLAELFGGASRRVEIFEADSKMPEKSLGQAKITFSLVAYASRTHADFVWGNRRVAFAKFQNTPKNGLDRLWWKELRPFAKGNPWEYEKEARLVVEVEKELEYDHIAIDFARPLEDLLKYNPAKRGCLPGVLLGPWSRQEQRAELAAGIRSASVAPILKAPASDFKTEQVGASELAGLVKLKGFVSC